MNCPECGVVIESTGQWLDHFLGCPVEVKNDG